MILCHAIIHSNHELTLNEAFKRKPSTMLLDYDFAKNIFVAHISPSENICIIALLYDFLFYSLNHLHHEL